MVCAHCRLTHLRYSTNHLSPGSGITVTSRSLASLLARGSTQIPFKADGRSFATLISPILRLVEGGGELSPLAFAELFIPKSLAGERGESYANIALRVQSNVLAYTLSYLP